MKFCPLAWLTRTSEAGIGRKSNFCKGQIFRLSFVCATLSHKGTPLDANKHAISRIYALDDATHTHPMANRSFTAR